MYPLRERRPSVLINRPARRPRLLLESLESRRLLSATSSGTTITPDVTTVTADFGQGPGFGGSGTGITNPTPASTALTPSQLAAAYSISLVVNHRQRRDDRDRRRLQRPEHRGGPGRIRQPVQVCPQRT